MTAHCDYCRQPVPEHVLPCPVCGAHPLHTCKNDRGFPISEIHPGRDPWPYTQAEVEERARRVVVRRAPKLTDPGGFYLPGYVMWGVLFGWLGLEATLWLGFAPEFRLVGLVLGAGLGWLAWWHSRRPKLQREV